MLKGSSATVLVDCLSFECIRRQVQHQGSQIQKEEAYTFDRKLEEALKPTTRSNPTKSSPEPLYLEVDGTIIHLQKQKKKKAELKLAILHKGKEKRYQTGTSQAKKLKDRWAYTGLCPGDEFMAKVSLLAKESFHLDSHKLILVGADGATWIKEGATDYFPQSIYQLCPFHLERKLTQTLSYNRIRQSQMRLLLKQDNIPKAVISLEEEKRQYPQNPKEERIK